jgi:hypothetical protein
MSFQVLARVEVQCIMQMLDRTSLLVLARCSPQTLQAADVSFVWKHVSPKRVANIPVIAYGVGRHIPIHWIACHRHLQLGEIAQLDRRLRQTCNLHTIRFVFDDGVTPYPWHQFARHEAMKSVREIHIDVYGFDTVEINALCGLPHLTFIRWQYSPNRAWISLLQSGLLPSNITSLQVDGTNFCSTPSAVFEAILSCVHVIQLAVRLTAVNGHEFLTSLVNRQTHTLKQLTLFNPTHAFWKILPTTLVSAFRGIVSLTLNASRTLLPVLDQLSECMDLWEFHLIDDPLHTSQDNVIAAMLRLHTSNQEKKRTMRMVLHYDSSRFQTHMLDVYYSFLTLCRDPLCPTQTRFRL